MESSSSLTVVQLRSNCNTLYFRSPGMGFVSWNFSALRDESRFTFELAHSPTRSISHTKIPRVRGFHAAILLAPASA